MRRTGLLPLVLVALLAGRSAAADEADQPDDLQPITIDDASPIDHRHATVELTTTWDRDRHGDDLFELRPRAKAGVLEGLELQLALPYTLGSADEAGQADLDLGAKYGLRDAGGGLPALALEADVTAPLGSRRGPDTALTFLASEPLTDRGEDGPALHLNLAWLHFFDARSGEERSDGYAAALGVSYPIDDDTGLVADMAHEDERERGRAMNLVEAGVRRELVEGLILSVGAGTGLPGDSPEFLLRVGLQHQFRAF